MSRGIWAAGRTPEFDENAEGFEIRAEPVSLALLGDERVEVERVGLGCVDRIHDSIPGQGLLKMGFSPMEGGRGVPGSLRLAQQTVTTPSGSPSTSRPSPAPLPDGGEVEGSADSMKVEMPDPLGLALDRGRNV